MRPKLNSSRSIGASASALACVTGIALSFSPMMASPVRAEASGGGAAGGIAEAASRYVIRLQERVKQADAAALRGNALMSDGDYEQAMASFRDALALLPDAAMTQDRRQAYIKQYSAAAIALARQRAEDGRYDDAIALLDSVLAEDVDPDNGPAKTLRAQIMDPEFYPVAMTPELRNKIRRVDTALKSGQSAIDLGDYDAADRFYHQALNDDKYNEAARRGLEKVERLRYEYFEAAHDQTRARFIREIEAGWEMPVPLSISNDIIVTTIATDGSAGVAAIEEKLKNIVIPSIEFSDTPLTVALEFLTQKSAELDRDEPDPTKKGINFILQAGSGTGGGGGAIAAPAADGGPVFDDPAGGGGGGGGSTVGGTLITLKLSNVPLVEAVRYTTSLAQLKYKVEPHAVVVVPLSTPDADLYTNVYQVPPTFLNQGGGDGGGAAAPVDPFAPDAGGGGGTALSARPDARQILERAGVTFGEGASAIYQPGTSQLIVRNTQDQMELVEAYIESIKDSAEKQIYITTKFIEIGQEVNEELGFDWLLGPFNIDSSATTFGSGGTSGNQLLPIASDFPLSQGGTPIGSNPVTSGLRSGGFAVTDDSIDGLIAAAAGTGAGAPVKAPGIFGIAGIFTDVQYQMVIRALNQQKGVDLLSAPSVMARSGQRAKVEVIREFIYPTEYDPPEIPNQVGGGITTGLGGGGSSSAFPVTPANPTAFETRNTGVTLEVDPVIGADEFTIDLNLAPEVVEFEGFINYGSPIQSSATNALTGVTSPVVLTENRILQPIFNTRRVSTQITIWDGQTVAIGGLIREDIQDVEDKVPLLGDIPVLGRLFRSSVERHLKRNLTVFVTARIKDPSGQDYHHRDALEGAPPLVVPPVPGARPFSGPTVFAPMPGPAK